MNRVALGFIPSARAIDRQVAVTKLDFLRTKIVLKLLVLVVLAVVMALFYIWSRVQMVQMGYEINGLKQEQQILLDQNKRYKTELMVLKSPQRLSEIATKDLGLVSPSIEHMVKLP